MSAQGRRIVGDLHRHKQCWDFSQDRLAEDAAEAAAMGIYITMDYQTDPDGQTWDKLNEKYAKWKAKHRPGMLIGERDGHMKTQEELKGEITLDPDGMTQTYGLDDQAQNEAEWFSEGNDHRPAREFYALNAKAEELLNAVFDTRFKVIVG